MSRTSDRKAMSDALVTYPLMTVPELAQFLRCSDDHARGLLEDRLIPFTDIGRGKKREYRIDPMDAAVFHLAGREGLTTAEFAERHGPDGTPELCARYVRQIRKIQAAA